MNLFIYLLKLSKRPILCLTRMLSFMNFELYVLFEGSGTLVTSDDYQRRIMCFLHRLILNLVLWVISWTLWLRLSKVPSSVLSEWDLVFRLHMLWHVFGVKQQFCLTNSTLVVNKLNYLHPWVPIDLLVLSEGHLMPGLDVLPHTWQSDNFITLTTESLATHFEIIAEHLGDLLGWAIFSGILSWRHFHSQVLQVLQLRGEWWVLCWTTTQVNVVFSCVYKKPAIFTFQCRC